MTLDEKIETLRSLAARLTRQATTQPNTKCDPNLVAHGRSVCVLSGTSTAIEAVVVRVREQLEIPLDWHYFGGRANVLTAQATPPEMDEKIRQHVRMALPRWGDP